MIRRETKYTPVVYKGPRDTVTFDGIRLNRGQTMELTKKQIARLRNSDPQATIESVLFRYVGKGNRIGDLPLRDLSESDYAALTPEYRALLDTNPHDMKVYERVKG
jgi:hypothetical protein